MQLKDLAPVVRSKNAGPRCQTLDIIFADAEGFVLAVDSPSLSRDAVARLYRRDPKSVRVIAYPPANAIKIVIERLATAGDPGDSDLYGAQQNGPLLGIEL